MDLKGNINSMSEPGEDPPDRIVINVGGMKFESHIATLQNIQDTRLAWLTENTDPETLKTEEFFFDRHPGAFVYILNFYRTGKLHIPMEMCGPAFEEELQYWGIDEKQMEPCCWETFTKHREAEENLRSFEGPGFEDLQKPKNRKISVISNHGLARERRSKIWRILDDPHSSKRAKIFSFISCFMIILSVSGYCISTLPNIPEEVRILLNAINYICVIFFTIEFFCRLVTTPNRKEFMMDYSNWIDIISIVPSYLVLVLDNTTWVKNLVIIRLLRVFKFFKLSYGLQVLLHTLKASSYELTLLILILLIPLVIFSSLVYAVEFNINRKKTKFCSIPDTFWWCLITMTTVGYGDITPETWPGKLIGSVCAIFGVLLLALPISMIGGNFSLYYAHVRARLKLPQKNRKLLQGNVRGLLKSTKNFSLRDRDRKILKRTNHNAIRLKSDVNLSPTSAKKILHRQEYFEELSSKGDVSLESFTMLNRAPLPNINRARNNRRTALIRSDISYTETPTIVSSNENLQRVEKKTLNRTSGDYQSELSKGMEPLNVVVNNQIVDGTLNNRANASHKPLNKQDNHKEIIDIRRNADILKIGSNPTDAADKESTIASEKMSNILSDSDITNTNESTMSCSQRTSWSSSSCCSSLSSLPNYRSINSYSLNDLIDSREIDKYDKTKSQYVYRVSPSVDGRSNDLHSDGNTLKSEEGLDRVNNNLSERSKSIGETCSFGNCETENATPSNRRTSMAKLTDCEKVMSENDVNTTNEQIGINSTNNDGNLLKVIENDIEWDEDHLLTNSSSKALLPPKGKALHFVLNRPHKKFMSSAVHLNQFNPDQKRTYLSTPFLNEDDLNQKRLTVANMRGNGVLNRIYHKESGV